MFSRLTMAVLTCTVALSSGCHNPEDLRCRTCVDGGVPTDRPPQTSEDGSVPGPEAGAEASIDRVICSPLWTCEAWSSCSCSGKKARSCKDSRACGVTENMPPTEEPCTGCGDGTCNPACETKSNCSTDCGSPCSCSGKECGDNGCGVPCGGCADKEAGIGDSFCVAGKCDRKKSVVCLWNRTSPYNTYTKACSSSCTSCGDWWFYEPPGKRGCGIVTCLSSGDAYGVYVYDGISACYSVYCDGKTVWEIDW